jgi:pimeloyl-ACP methyl ester carboxylesterase
MSNLVERLHEDLTLGPAAFEDQEQGHDDGTRPTGVLTTQGIVPGFWTVQGYDRLLWHLRFKLEAGADEILPFPYDWRQSNRVTAKKFKAWIEPIVKARRTTHKEARLLLIGHSMGGLVARYYAEVLDEFDYTRRVVTIGTPYQGAVKALRVLANGYGELAGRRVDVGDLVRSWPSAAELLPMYPCLGSSASELSKLGDLEADRTIGGLPATALKHGLAFHADIDKARLARPRPLLYRAILGYHQPTDVWASLVPADGAEDDGAEDDDQPAQLIKTHRYVDPLQQGDGTVPRQSATPPEWEGDEDLGIAPSMDRHGALQQADSVVRQLVLVASSGKFREGMSGDRNVTVEAAPVVEPGQPCEIVASAVDGSDRLALAVELYAEPEEPADPDPSSEPEPAEPIATEQLRADRDQPGRYTAQLPVPEAGLYRWRVVSRRGATTKVDPVSDLVLSLAADD